MSGLRLTAAVIVLGYLTGAACTSTDSSFVATRGIVATFAASADGTGMTEVTAKLRVSGSSPFDFVALVGGDVLTATRIDPATLAEQEQVMIERMFLGRTTYSAFFLGQAKDTGFEVALDRSRSGHVSGNDSSVTLPTPFVLDWVADPVAMTSAPNPLLAKFIDALLRDLGSLQRAGPGARRPAPLRSH